MKNDVNLHSMSPKRGGGSFFPTSIRAISTYVRSISANASNIASSVRSAAVYPASNGSLHDDDRRREQVQWAGFDILELDSGDIRHVLLLTYGNGFQIWDVEEACNVREIVSRRDGPVAFLRLQPKPYPQESTDGGGPGTASRPLLLVVTGDISNTGSQSPGGFPGNYSAGGIGSPPGATGSQFIPTLIRFYSLQTHTYVHVLRFGTGIYAVRCSPRVVVVALYSQIHCFDAVSLQNTFSVVTSPTPLTGAAATFSGFGALAVGPRWLAYASNQPVAPITGRISPQHLTPSPGASPSTSPHNASLVAHYAKESSKHIAAGIVSLGDMGYKTLSRYCSELMPDSTISPGANSASWKSTSNGTTHHEPPEYAGTVIVRDLVSKTILTQFRAHPSPLSALAFDPSGTLLVTASIHGHNLNVFRLTPSTNGNGMATNGFDTSMSHVHLYKLYRGLTNGVMQDISFTSDSKWIAVSSSRGTSHIYALSPFGGNVGPQTHSAVPIDGLIGPTLMPPPAYPWWSSPGPLKSTQQQFPSPPQAVNITVVNRIKTASSGWRDTVTGAAAAATGRTGNHSSAVAAIFHDGGSPNLDMEMVNGCLKEQLWVLSPSGNLMRYLLRPSAGPDGGYNNNVGGGNSMSSGTPNSSQQLRLVTEPVERWDVSRRPNWVEREERVDYFSGPGVGYEDATLGAMGRQRGVSRGQLIGELGRDDMSLEEMQRWFMSNAEVQMHNQARPLPIWAKSKVYFHVMLPKELENEGGPDVANAGGEIEIENFPTRVVEVRRKDLVPVIERLHVFTKVKGARDLASENVPAMSGLQLQLFVDDGLQEGSYGANASGKHIHTTSSGSSFGSEGGPNGGIMNAFHHDFQDFPEIPVEGMNPSVFDSAPSYFSDSQQEGIGAVSPYGRNLPQGTLLNPNQINRGNIQPNFVSEPLVGPHIMASAPLSSVPRVAQRDVLLNKKRTVGESGPISGNEHVSVDTEHDSVDTQNREVLMCPQLQPHAEKVGPEPNVDFVQDDGITVEGDGHIIGSYDQMSFAEMGIQQSQDSPTPTGHQPWDLEPLVRLSQGGIVVRDLDDRPDAEVDSHAQDGSKGAEDAKRTDAHSKSGDPADDDAMFPFSEEEEDQEKVGIISILGNPPMDPAPLVT